MGSLGLLATIGFLVARGLRAAMRAPDNFRRILAAGLFIMFFNLISSLFTGKKAGDNPWEGATLEWQTTSPPPTENFEKTPVVTKGPYTFR